MDGPPVDLAEVVRTSPHALVVARQDGSLVWANDAAVALLGLPAGDTGPGSTLLPLVAPRQRARAQQLLEAAAGGLRGGPVRLRLVGEQERWVAVSGGPAGPGTAQLSLVEVTDVVLARRRLRESESRFRTAFDVGVSGNAVLDEDDRFVVVNRALAALLGRDQQELVGLRPDDVLHEDDIQLLRRGSEVYRAPLRLRTAAGEVRHTLVTTTRLDDHDRRLLFVQVEDVTDRHVSDERLRHLAMHDSLTDLPGRPLVLSRLETALLRGEGITAVLFVDLDGFKLVNDALGHAAGDRVLQQAAQRLREAVRPGDTVGRFGGDEFLVLCPGLASRADGVAVAQRIDQAVSAPFPFSGDEVLISASVGVAFAEPGSEVVPLADDLVHDADTAMYRAKQLGKRRYEVFDQAMRERAAERARTEQLVSRAVAEDRLVVHYQPVVDLLSREVVGLEALVRLRDDDGRELPPSVFLDVAQESGLLPDFDDVVLERAAGQVASWRAELGLDLELAVNVCAARVTAELPDTVEAALHASGLPADRLVLELTEQALVTSAPAAGLALERLVDSGVRLAIDDFGTGWASLTYLRRFPISIVKVDRSFVHGLPDEQDDVVIVQAVVDLARQLGLQCTVEGVEHEGQYAALRAMAPPFAQGYLFGRPVPPEQVPALLAREP